jgi:hypothetical protein
VIRMFAIACLAVSSVCCAAQSSSILPPNADDENVRSADRASRQGETSHNATEAPATEGIEPDESAAAVAEPTEVQTSLLKMSIRQCFWMEARRLMGEKAEDDSYAQLALSVQLYNNRSRRPVRVKTAYLISEDGARYEDISWQDELGLGKRVSDLEVESLKVTFLTPIFVVPKDSNYRLVIEHYGGEKAQFRLRPRSWEEHLEYMMSLAVKAPTLDKP